MSDIYYTNKKSQFKSNFGKEWDENLSDFLQFVNIEITREFIGEISVLKESIDDLKQSNYDTKQ